MFDTTTYTIWVIPGYSGYIANKSRHQFRFAFDGHANRFAIKNGIRSLRIEFHGLGNSSRSNGYELPRPIHTDAHIALKNLRSMLELEEIKWFEFVGKNWFLDLDQFYKDLHESLNPSIVSLGSERLKHVPFDQLFKGKVQIEPLVENVEAHYGEMRTDVIFEITEESVMKKRIFLSHKSANKPMVKRFYSVLETLGLEPWLDEEDIVAGSDVPFRQILDGLEESCAVIFFITKEFKDETWLKAEIDYSVRRSIEDKDFALITIVFSHEENGETTFPKVPLVLEHSGTYKRVQTDIDGLREVLKAIPLSVGVLGKKSK